MNINALPGTYLTNLNYTEMTSDPFAITAQNFELNTAKAVNGLPIVQAYMLGYPTDVSPYFMIDFSNSRTVVWNDTCN